MDIRVDVCAGIRVRIMRCAELEACGIRAEGGQAADTCADT